MADASVKTVYSTAAITHVGSGEQLTAGAMMASSATSVALSSTNMGRYPRADIVLTYSHTTSMSSASAATYLYRRDMNVDGTGDEPYPETATNVLYKNKFMGAFIAKPQSATSNSHVQYLQLTDVPLSDNCEFYIENGTNATILAGWTLKVLPKTDTGATS